MAIGIVFDGGFSDAMLQCIFDHRSTIFHNLCYILFMRDTPLVKVCFDELTISQGYLAFYVSMCNTCIVILHAPDESCLSMYKISSDSSDDQTEKTDMRAEI